MPTECKQEHQAIRDLLSSGCDERLFFDSDSHRNKYHVDTLYFNNVHYRGSCTCGSLTPFTWPVAVRALERIKCSTGADFDEWSEDQRRRLKVLIAGDSGLDFDVFFGPSGSDLLYYPILFRHELQSRPVLNVVSCPEELGSGSNLAAEGKYHSENGPFGDTFKKSELLSNTLIPKVVQLGARTIDGKIRPRALEIQKVVAAHPSHSCIVNLVYGSKSGIKDDLEVIDPDQDILWTVDLCQFRADPVLIRDLLRKGVMVLITGSKFYNAPPFCGALLVPEKWSKLLSQVSGESFRAVTKIFAKSDIPQRMNNIRDTLIYDHNKGLNLRWECALAEMEAYNALPREQTNGLINQWNFQIVKRLSESDFFELMPDQSLTNPSIISFRVIRDHQYFSHDELKKLFELFVCRTFSEEYSFDRIFIGQPVQYGERSFIRFALGSWAVRQLLKVDGMSWAAELEMVEAFENEVKMFGRTKI